MHVDFCWQLKEEQRRGTDGVGWGAAEEKETRCPLLPSADTGISLFLPDFLTLRRVNPRSKSPD